jgi:hypothetical protein
LIRNARPGNPVLARSRAWSVNHAKKFSSKNVS